MSRQVPAKVVCSDGFKQTGRSVLRTANTTDKLAAGADFSLQCQRRDLVLAQIQMEFFGDSTYQLKVAKFVEPVDGALVNHELAVCDGLSARGERCEDDLRATNEEEP